MTDRRKLPIEERRQAKADALEANLTAALARIADLELELRIAQDQLQRERDRVDRVVNRTPPTGGRGPDSSALMNWAEGDQRRGTEAQSEAARHRWARHRR